MTKNVFKIFGKGKIIKCSVISKLMTYRLVANAQTFCTTLIHLYVAKFWANNCIKLFWTLLFISIGSSSQYGGISFHLKQYFRSNFVCQSLSKRNDISICIWKWIYMIDIKLQSHRSYLIFLKNQE